jgi:hypothetical protein
MSRAANEFRTSRYSTAAAAWVASVFWPLRSKGFGASKMERTTHGRKSTDRRRFHTLERILVECRCGAVQIELVGEALVDIYCHCDDCQAVHGGAYVPESVYRADACV